MNGPRTKLFPTVVLTTCLNLMFALALHAQWTSLGPNGTHIQCLSIDPIDQQTLYAGTSSVGIYKTIDGGQTWRAINTGLANLDIPSIAIDPVDPQTVYAGTNGKGVFKSTNGGGIWTTVNGGLPDSLDVHCLVIDPRYPQTIYVGTFGYGVFKSTNGGSSWSDFNPEVCRFVRTLVIDPRNP